MIPDASEAVEAPDPDADQNDPEDAQQAEPDPDLPDVDDPDFQLLLDQGAQEGAED